MGAVGVFIRVRKGVVDPVPGHPVDRAPFRGQHPDKGHQIFQEFRDFKGAVVFLRGNHQRLMLL